MFPEGLVSQSLRHRILLTSHHLNLAKSYQMSFLPKLHKLHLFSVIYNTVILPKNSFLGRVISSLALQIHHLYSQFCRLYLNVLPCTLFHQNFQLYGIEDVIGEKEGILQMTERQDYENQKAFSSTEKMIHLR